MPSYESILDEVQVVDSPIDKIRSEYIKKFCDFTGRNIVIYYSGFSQKSKLQREINFMNIGFDKEDIKNLIRATSELDTNKGLDLILHIPNEGTGCDITAVRSLLDYLRSKFGNNIRAIIPQMVTSTGTMIALSCKEIIMGNYSSIGSIDPIVGGISANGILDEIESAALDAQLSSKLGRLWSPIISKYDQTFINKCQESILLSGRIVKMNLISGMLSDDDNAEKKAKMIWDDLGDLSMRKSNDRRLSLKYVKNLGIKVVNFKEIEGLEELLLNIHYILIQNLANTPLLKIIENQEGEYFKKYLSL